VGLWVVHTCMHADQVSLIATVELEVYILHYTGWSSKREDYREQSRWRGYWDCVYICVGSSSGI